MPGRASHPQWLIIPERGLYTGMAIVGAIGSGKTSACMYPYVEQLLAYRAGEPARRSAGLILEVKGDFCRHVRNILERHGRGDDYIEVSLDSEYRYNPLHNDLDAYALAYGIATLMTNLFGRGKEPFWQQASTNLVKFVILLHQVLDDYVTLFQVYEHVINPDKLRTRIQEGETRFNAEQPAHRRRQARAHASTDVPTRCRGTPARTDARAWTYWSKDIEDSLTQQRMPHEVTKVQPDSGRATSGRSSRP